MQDMPPQFPLSTDAQIVEAALQWLESGRVAVYEPVKVLPLLADIVYNHDYANPDVLFTLPIGQLGKLSALKALGRAKLPR